MLEIGRVQNNILVRAFLFVCFDSYYHRVEESKFQRKERWNPTSSPTSAKLPILALPGYYDIVDLFIVEVEGLVLQSP